MKHPSTFRASRGELFLVLLVITILLSTVEVATRLVVRRLSRIEGRIAAEYHAILAPATSTRPVVWFLGNSLLEAAVDFPALRESLKGSMEARRFIVEQTSFHDWHYAIRKLLREAAKPQSLVLMLNGKQLIGSGSRGDYAAQAMVSHGDILAFARDLEVHPTNAAGLVLANFSMFYGLRSEIRKVLMSRLLPDLPRLTARLVAAGPAEIPAPQLRMAAQQRLEVLREECARCGVRLIFAIPPDLDFESVRNLEAGVKAAQVQVLAPFGAGEFQTGDFSDGFHLNASGARRYTRLLEEAVAKSER